MIEISSLVALIVIEVFVGLAALSGFLLISTLLRQARIRKAAAHLAERVQSDKPKREERLHELLQERYRLTGTELDQTLHNIMRMEMMLYQNVINGFLKDDQIQLQQLDVDVENLVTSYQGLDVPDSSSVTQQLSGEDEEEISRLREENGRLSDELKVTMDTMGRMLNEYSTMFSGGATDSQSGTARTAGAAAEDQSLNEVVEEDVEPEVQESTQEIPESTLSSGLVLDTEIPDPSAEELAVSSDLAHGSELGGEDPDSQQSASIADESLEEDGAETDEEVSEIIDEVMEIADEMLEESELSTEADSGVEAETETEAESNAGESMVDDLDNIDIEIPVEDESQEQSTEFEAGSLEEEWAKLLEEDAENSKKEGQDP
jgi:hypothetical protein